MIHIYGIHNCDTVQKALKWLDARKIAYTFHNYKETGLDKATIEHWLQHFPVDKLINACSTTFKELPESDRASITDHKKAIALIMQHTSIVKRPVWDFGNGNYFLGWNEEQVRSLMK